MSRTLHAGSHSQSAAHSCNYLKTHRLTTRRGAPLDSIPYLNLKEWICQIPSKKRNKAKTRRIRTGLSD